MPSADVFKKFKAGTLRSGGPKGPVVRNRKQAIAIKLSEQKNEAKRGGRYEDSPISKAMARRTKK